MGHRNRELVPDSWSLVLVVGERALTTTLENEMGNRHTKKQTLVFAHLHERVVEAGSLQVGCELKQQGALLLGGRADWGPGSDAQCLPAAHWGPTDTWLIDTPNA